MAVDLTNTQAPVIPPPAASTAQAKAASDPAPVKVAPSLANGDVFAYTDKDVTTYASDLGKVASEMGFVVGPTHTFGLAVDIFDPVSGHIIAVLRPRRRDLGVPGIHLSLDQVRAAVAAARTYRVNEDRANGIVAPPAPAAKVA